MALALLSSAFETFFLYQWAIVFLVVAIVLLVLEIFLPSGGILGFFSVASAITSVTIAFTISVVGGTFFLLAVVFGGFLFVNIAIAIWPDTPLGKLILIPKILSPDDVLPNPEKRQQLKELIGRQGVASRQMAPHGKIKIDGQAYPALTEGELINKGDSVEIFAVRLNQLIVRPVESLQTGHEEPTLQEMANPAPKPAMPKPTVEPTTQRPSAETHPPVSPPSLPQTETPTQPSRPPAPPSPPPLKEERPLPPTIDDPLLHTFDDLNLEALDPTPNDSTSEENLPSDDSSPPTPEDRQNRP
ncbi:MAG: NfeD family protein [Pirellulaceae bacterium]|nr:NfeD family protein [Pirellulaceae bacterium]